MNCPAKLPCHVPYLDIIRLLVWSDIWEIIPLFWFVLCASMCTDCQHTNVHLYTVFSVKFSPLSNIIHVKQTKRVNSKLPLLQFLECSAHSRTWEGAIELQGPKPKTKLSCHPTLMTRKTIFSNGSYFIKLFWTLDTNKFAWSICQNITHTKSTLSKLVSGVPLLAL